MQSVTFREVKGNLLQGKPLPFAERSDSLCFSGLSVGNKK